MEKNDISHLRQDYTKDVIHKSDLNENPVKQFELWFHQAMEAKIDEPNAMILATANKDGRPSARTVLLKGFSDEGFIFYTNYKSQKAQELEQNPKAALVFNWLGLQRQVRINGTVVKLDSERSSEYFQSRPKESQIGAWASPQSEVIADRSILEDRVNVLKREFESVNVLPKPDHWGGYLVKADEIEFWQGRKSRLHDRFRYQKHTDHWIIERLAP